MANKGVQPAKKERSGDDGANEDDVKYGRDAHDEENDVKDVEDDDDEGDNQAEDDDEEDDDEDEEEAVVRSLRLASCGPLLTCLSHSRAIARVRE
jgi:hypothetical protein